jgi:hypothetical protein
MLHVRAKFSAVSYEIQGDNRPNYIAQGISSHAFLNTNKDIFIKNNGRDREQKSSGILFSSRSDPT